MAMWSSSWRTPRPAAADRMAGEDITAREIAAMLNAQVDSLAPSLLPGGRREGKYFCAGSVGGEAGMSLKVNLAGAMRGKWTDFSASEGTDDYSGDMLSLVSVVKFGGRLADAIAWAKSHLGIDDLDPARLATVRREAAAKAERTNAEADKEKAEKQSRAWQLWRDAEPIARTPGLAYLAGRGIDLALLGRAPGSLRYRPDVWCPERRGKFPAMLACIMGLDGRHLGTHRTYLDISGWSHRTKSGRVLKQGGLRDPKLSLGAFAGGHIPLWKGESPKTLRDVPRGTPVYVSEGIEDGLTIALAMPAARVIAGVALANMGGIAFPPQVGPVIFIGQNDPINSKAVAAFERAIARQQEAGRKVQTFFPPPEFKDFNDQLTGKPIAPPAPEDDA